MNEYAVFKHYNYTEIYYVNAVSERAAILIVDDLHFDEEPDDVIQEFDSYDVIRQEKP